MTGEEKNNLSFEIGEVVAAEYEYIAQTAFQAQEDRARVTTFYLVSIGSLFGAFFGTTFSSETETLTYIAFASLFLFLSYFSLLTLKQLIRLRKAWLESAKAMNQLKDFLITQNKDLKNAFRWTSKTLPSLYQPKSLAYLLAQQVAMLGAITFGAMTYYASLAFLSGFNIQEFAQTNPFLFGGAILSGLLFLKYQMNIYRKELSA